MARAGSLRWPVEVTGHVGEDVEPAVEALLQNAMTVLVSSIGVRVCHHSVRRC